MLVGASGTRSLGYLSLSFKKGRCVPGDWNRFLEPFRPKSLESPNSCLALDGLLRPDWWTECLTIPPLAWTRLMDPPLFRGWDFPWI